MNILRPARSFTAAASLLLFSVSHAQTTKEGYALSWDKTITVVRDSIMNGKYKLPAFTVPVFESDADAAMDLWKTDMKTKCQEIVGGKPSKAVGAMFLAVSPTPMLMVASSTTEKKAGAGRLTLAFAQNDSTPVADQQTAEQVAREIAVLLNKAGSAEADRHLHEDLGQGERQAFGRQRGCRRQPEGHQQGETTTWPSRRPR